MKSVAVHRLLALRQDSDQRDYAVSNTTE